MSAHGNPPAVTVSTVPLHSWTGAAVGLAVAGGGDGAEVGGGVLSTQVPHAPGQKARNTALLLHAAGPTSPHTIATSGAPLQVQLLHVTGQLA